MKNIVIFGATGNTGGATVEALLASPPFAAKEIRVSALVRDPQSEKAKALKEKGVLLVEGSYDNKETLKTALAKADSCFLCCNNCLNQVELETNVIDAAEKSATCQYLVKISTCQASVKDQPTFISADSVIQYGRCHAAIEERLDQCKTLQYTVLRPNYFMQNFVGDIFGTLPQKNTVYPQQNDYKANIIDLRDIGAVAAQLLLLENAEKYQGKALNICGPKAWSITELASLYSKTLGKDIEYIRCNEEGFVQGLEGAGFPEWLAKSVTKTHTVFWDHNGLDYESSPEIQELLPQWRTTEEWVAEMAPMVQFAE